MLKAFVLERAGIEPAAAEPLKHAVDAIETPQRTLNHVDAVRQQEAKVSKLLW